MSFSQGEQELLDKIRKLVLLHASRHTGVLAYTRKQAQGLPDYGCASCVYIEYHSRQFTITCEHVTRNAGSLYDLAIAPSDNPAIFGPVTNLSASIVLREDAQHDLAVLDAQTVDFSLAQKQPFPLKRSESITKAELELPPPLTSFIYGTLGTKAHLIANGQNLHFDGPHYSGGGANQNCDANRDNSRHKGSGTVASQY